MDHREGWLGVGSAAAVAGTTVRTLQYYDRIGLLVAHRTPDGRRGYDQALLEQVQRIRLMTELGVGLDRIAEVLARRPATAQWEVYAEQAALMELAELRLRCRRAVAAGLANVLRRHPSATVPTEAMRALISFEDTLLAFRDVDPVETVPDDGEELVGEVIELYLRWKTLAVQAVVLQRHGVEPTSGSADLLGRDWQAYLAFAASTGDAARIAERSQDISDTWPEADRRLYDSTRSYLEACHRHHLSGGGA